MNYEQLSKLIILSCKKAIKEEITSLKKELLIEIRKSNNLNEMQKDFRQKFPTHRPAKTSFSRDSTLNEILKQTSPLERDSRQYEYDREDNIPTDNNGRPITNIPESLYNAMNKDYSKIINYGNSNSSPLREQYKNMIESSDDSFDSDNYVDEDFERRLQAEINSWNT